MKTSRIKSIQVEQYQYALQKPSVEFIAYPIAGSTIGSVRKAPSERSISNRGSRDFGPDWHPNWINELPDFGVWIPRDTPNQQYDTSRGFAQMMDSMTAKDSDLAGGTTPNQTGFSGQSNGFAQAYFPVVYRISPSHVRTTGVITNDHERITVIPFRVVASTWPWKQNEGGLDYPPQYETEQIFRDGVRIDLHVDRRFLSADDEHSYYAVLGSVLSVLPSRWSEAITTDNVLQVYLTIAPAISLSDYDDHIAKMGDIMKENAPRGDACFRFDGPSLGLAVLAAIMGMPPIMYTGFNSQMGPSEILSGDGTIQEVALGANMVEPIEDYEYKTAAAIMIGVPIIIPLNLTWQREPTKQALYRGVARAIGANSGRNTLLALAAKEYGYPANMTKALALANDGTNWAVSMNEFIYTTAKRAAGLDFNQMPSLVLAATNLSDVQILAAHATAYIWSPGRGGPIIRTTPSGEIAGRKESRTLADYKQKTQRAEKLAREVGMIDIATVQKRGELRGEFRNLVRDGPASGMWETKDLFGDGGLDEDGAPKRAAPIPKPVAKKAGGKKAVGRSSGAVRVRGKAAAKKKAPKKKATKKKPKKKASSKKKGGKKKSSGRASGSKKKSAGRASGSVAAAKKKKKKKGKKNKKKRPLGKASGSKKAKKAKSKTAKKKKSKSKKSHKKKTKLGRAAGYRVLGSARRGRSGTLTAKQIMQRALAKARGGKK